MLLILMHVLLELLNLASQSRQRSSVVIVILSYIEAAKQHWTQALS